MRLQLAADAPPRHRRSFARCVLLSTMMLSTLSLESRGAETSPPTETPASHRTGSLPAVFAEAKVSSSPPRAPAPSRRDRLVSPRIAALLDAAAPSFHPPASTSSNSAAASGIPEADLPPTNDIVRLPSYIVREAKLPKFAEVERREIARRAMEKYLGPENGFDRGFLNLFTSEQIPILALFGSVSNEARAMARYREDERIQLKADLLEMAALTKLGGDPATAQKLKRETEDAFRRD